MEIQGIPDVEVRGGPSVVNGRPRRGGSGDPPRGRGGKTRRVRRPAARKGCARRAEKEGPPRREGRSVGARGQAHRLRRPAGFGNPLKNPGKRGMGVSPMSEVVDSRGSLVTGGTPVPHVRRAGGRLGLSAIVTIPFSLTRCIRSRGLGCGPRGSPPGATRCHLAGIPGATCSSDRRSSRTSD
jgi:hypothetical protein